MQQIQKLTEQEMYEVYRQWFPEAFPKDEIRPWRSIRRQVRAGRYEGWGLYENGQLYSYAFFFHRGNIFFLDYLATLPAARGKGLGGTFLCLLQRGGGAGRRQPRRAAAAPHAFLCPPRL